VKPLHVSASNYRRFADLELELPNGVAAIVGPNGAGKSSLVDLIELALFADRGELAQWLTTGEDELRIVLEFEHGGERYRVTRTYSARGRGKSTLDLDRYLDAPEHTGDDRGPGWEPLTRETAAETQQLIHDTLRLSRATFRASAFCGQGDGANFAKAAPRDRKQVLAEILALDTWADLLARTRTFKLEAEQQLQQHAGRRGVLQTAADALPEHRERVQALTFQVDNDATLLADAEAQAVELFARLEEARRRAETRRARAVALDAGEAARARADRVRGIRRR
jgi:exonuclease SbcC